MTNCIYCNDVLNEKNISKEHIIQNALGGLIVSTEICCDSCNNLLEKHIDNSFCKIFSPILTNIPIKKTNKSNSPTAIGKAKFDEDKEVYSVIIKNNQVISCAEASRKHKKKFTKSDYKKFKILNYEFELTNNEFKQGLMKIAINYAIHSGIPKNTLEHLIKVEKNKEEKIESINFKSTTVPFKSSNYIDDYIELKEPITELYHKLILFSYQESLVCYIDLFNTFQFYVFLSNEWPGNSIHNSYLQTIDKKKRNPKSFTIRSIKDVQILSSQYDVSPSLNITKLNKDINQVIKKDPYEKEIVSYISNIINKNINIEEDFDLLISRHNATQFYMNSETEKLIKSRYKIFTPIKDVKGNRRCEFYPELMIKLVNNDRKSIRRYSHEKFKRLTEYIHSRNN